MGCDFIHFVTLIIGTPQNRLFRTGCLPGWKKRVLKVFPDDIYLGAFDWWYAQGKEKVVSVWKCFGWDCIPIFLSLQKALPAVANRKTECPFQTGFGITIGDIWENNRRYFQNIRTFSVNAYVFSAKCLLLFAKSQAFRARKPVFSASKVSIWLFSSLRVSETDKDSVMKNRYLLSFCTVIRWTDVIRLDCSEWTAGFVFRNGD